MTTEQPKYTLTDEHRAQLKPWADKWIANSLNCATTSEDDLRVAREAIRGLYVANDLPPPLDERVLLVRSPLTGAIACTISSGVWWLRDNPERQVELFTAKLNDADLLRAAKEAACTAALSALTGGAQAREGAAATAKLPSVEGKVAAQHAAVSAEAWAAIEQATRDPADANGNAASVEAVAAATRFLVLCVQYWGSFYNGGNQWSGWPAFLSFFRHIAKLPIDYSKWQHYETAATFGPRFMHQRFCLLSDRPEYIHRDDQSRPHSDRGPFCKWRDGWELYYLHGVRVNERIVTAPESYTAEEIKAEKNSEIVRALAERLGWTRFIEKLGGTTIDKWTDPKTGLDYELIECAAKWGDLQPRFLKMRSPELHDGTTPYYLEPIDPGVNTAQAARKWQLADWDKDDPQGLVKHANEHPELEFTAEA